MTKNLLTVLGCSGSLVLTLASSEAVYANNGTVVKELVFTAAETEETLAEAEFDCGCTADNVEGDFLNDDGLGDAAIAQYGCDCAGCRFIVREQMQAENTQSTPIIP